MNQLFTLMLCLTMVTAFAADETDSTQIFLDSLESSFNYQTGEIKFDDNIGTLTVPQGFRYLDSDQTRYILHDLWGNPGGEGTMGMLVPANIPITSMESWAFIITYEEMGYVKDDDADDIDYDEMLEELQSETSAENEQRTKEGYEPISIIGWATTPFYDKDKKILHWAKEIKFGDSEDNTLNYNVRVLGRKGVLVLNAVASMSALEEVKENINPVLTAFAYSEGNQYDDFDPEVDEVAAWTIGGLVAGKVLAKAGILALILKNIKLIGLAIVGLGGAIWKWFKGKTEPPAVREIGGGSNESNVS
ncbi:MAG TPA: DUF2167 domain-containing protein [Chryseolinea sp.]|nr:DUF2167 domain-containing protein [Chryseolinea sp.]